VGFIFKVYNLFGVRSLSLTSRSSLLILQYSAFSAISTNLSTSKISSGMFLRSRWFVCSGFSILSFVVFSGIQNHNYYIVRFNLYIC